MVKVRDYHVHESDKKYIRRPENIVTLTLPNQIHLGYETSSQYEVIQNYNGCEG